MIHHHRCPLCSSSTIKPVLSARDHTVSKETFSIWECETCTARFTQDVPDQNEIGHYYISEDYISHTETKQGFINRAYHAVREFTLQQKKKLVSRYAGVSKGDILDIGCGTGAFLKVMQDAGWTVQGLEPDQGARELAASRGVSVLPAEALQGLTSTHNAISMWHVLEHVHDLHGYLEKINLLLKPGGRLFIAVPNFTSADAVAYGESWAAYDVPRHLYHFSPASMKPLMALHGMAIESMEPMWFDSFYVSMLSEKYKKGAGSLISACWQGISSNAAALGHSDQCSSVIYVIRKII